MRDHEQNRTAQTTLGRDEPARRRMARRWGLGLAVGTVALVAIFGATSSLVGAVTTDRSTVHGNEFATTIRSDVGMYALAATPEDGATFGPGVSAGSVEFAVQPEKAAALPLVCGESVVAAVALPAGMTPGTLPDADTTSEYSLEWSAAEEGDAWVVRAAVTALTDAGIVFPGLAFPVTTQFSSVLPESALTVRGETQLPERFSSEHPTESATVPVAWNVDAGVYQLRRTGSGSSNSSVAFSSHPGSAAERLHLRAGDVLTTTVKLPAGVTAGTLPSAQTLGDRTITWAAAAAGSETNVTRTENVTADVVDYGPTAASFPIKITNAALSAGYTLQANADLPGRFVSGQPTMQTQIPPAANISGPGASHLAAGGGHSLAIGKSWYINGFGRGAEGQIGDGKAAETRTPVWVPNPTGQDFIHVSAGQRHSLGVSGDGKIYGWGLNSSGQTGTGKIGGAVTTATRAQPVDQATFFDASAGVTHSAAVSIDGRVYGWGSFAGGALGTASDSGSYAVPTRLSSPAGAKVVSVEAGYQSTFALTSDGTVWGMGSNTNGKLGLGEDVTRAQTFTQIPIPTSDPIIAVSSVGSGTTSHTLAISKSGELFGWGANASGQLGTTVAGERPAMVTTPVQLQLPDGVRFKKIAAGDQFSVGLTTDGRVFTWGGRALGNGLGQTYVPTQVTFPRSAGAILDIAAGDMHGLAMGSDYSVYGWGYEFEGRLGNAGNSNRPTPIPITLQLNRSLDAATDDAADDAADASDAADPAHEKQDSELEGPEAIEEADTGETDEPADPELEVGVDAEDPELEQDPDPAPNDEGAETADESSTPELDDEPGAPAARAGAPGREHR